MGVATEETASTADIKPKDTVLPNRPNSTAAHLLNKKHDIKSLQLTDFQYRYREECAQCKVAPLKMIEELVKEHISYGYHFHLGAFKLE